MPRSLGKTLSLPVLALPVLALLVLAAGCERPVASGFLSPYDGFQRCGLLTTNLEYVNPQADWPHYQKVRILQPVVFYAPGAQAVSQRDAEAVTAFFGQKLVEAFGKDCQVVADPGSDVIDVRVAITNLRPTNVLKNAAVQTAGFFIPVVWDVGIEGYKQLSGDQLGMGEAQMEAEFLDSESQQRLYGYVARKIGSSLDVLGQATAWGVVEAALTKWAGILHDELKYRQDPSLFKKLAAQMK